MEKERTFDALIDSVLAWANDKKILEHEYHPKQIMKVVEELGETCDAINKKNVFAIADGLGDTFVTLIILTAQLGYRPIDVLEIAYNEIKNRTGKTENGVFIKDR